MVGETIRDYQLNVINCVFDILANFTTQNSNKVGDAFVFECSDTVKFIDKSLKAKSYSWDFGDPTTDGDTSSDLNPTYVYPGNGDYVVKLKVQNQICEDDYSFKVRIRSKKTFELGPDIILCDDPEYYLDTRTPDATKVIWNTGYKHRQYLVKDTGLYIATVFYDKCIYSDSVHIGRNPVSMTPLPDSLFCYENEIDVVAEIKDEGFRYRWLTGNPLDTTTSLHITKKGNYSYLVYNQNCAKTDTFRFWVATPPNVEDTTICNDFIYKVDAGKLEQGSYLWSNLSTQRETQFTKPGTNWIRTKQRHCVFSDTFTIFNPVVVVELPDDEHFCDQVDIDLDAGPGKVLYEWSFDENSRKVHINFAGVIWVKATDEYGCFDSDTIVLTMTQSPHIDLGDDTTVCVSTPVTLSVPDFYQSYTWSTGNTENSLTALKEGAYFITVVDEFGCIGTDSLNVFHDPDILPNELFVPNAFSPNNDGLNDLFPYSKPMPYLGYFVAVYDRWGEKVFDSRESQSQNWDGIYKGQIAPNQAFIYIIEYIGCDGTLRTRMGTVNPFR